MEKFKHLMIDLETLSFDTNCVIITIAAVPFNMNGKIGPEFEKFPDVDSQKDRVISWQNIKWWFSQDNSIRDQQVEAMRNQNLKECLVDLFQFCTINLDDDFKVWSNGSVFDISVLNSAFEKYNIIVPWSYKNQFDCRTMSWISKISVNSYTNKGLKHSAIDDCKWQISWLIDSYKIINY